MLATLQSPDDVIDQQKRKESSTSHQLNKHEVLSQPRATDESDLSSAIDDEKGDEDDVPIVSTTSTSSGGEDVEQCIRQAMGTTDIDDTGPLTPDKGIVSDIADTALSRGKNPGEGSQPAMGSGDFGGPRPERIERNVVTVEAMDDQPRFERTGEQDADNEQCQAYGENEVANAEEDSVHGNNGASANGHLISTISTDLKMARPASIGKHETQKQAKLTEQARRQGPEDPSVEKSISNLLSTPLTEDMDDLKKVQLELGLSVKNEQDESEDSNDDELKELEAELQTIRWELGIYSWDTEELDRPLSDDRMAISGEDDLKRDSLHLRRELGIVGGEIDVESDAVDEADASPDLSNDVDDNVSVFQAGVTEAYRQDVNHVLAVSAVAAVALEESSEMKKTQDLEVSFAAAPLEAATVGDGEQSLSPRSSAQFSVRPGAVAVRGIRSILRRQDRGSSNPGSAVSMNTTSAEVANGRNGNNDAVVVADPTDMLVNATLVNQTETGILAVVVNGEPVTASPPPRQESLGTLVRNKAYCASPRLCASLVSQRPQQQYWQQLE